MNGGSVPPATPVLWVGNNQFSGVDPNTQPPPPPFVLHPPVFAMDLGGNEIVMLEDTPLSGVAFDGTDLWFSNTVAGQKRAKLTRRDRATGNQVGPERESEAMAPNVLDMAFDPDRSELWRIEHSPAALTMIDRGTGEVMLRATIDPNDLDEFNSAYGITYDTKDKVLYVSFNTFMGSREPGGGGVRGGVIRVFAPGTGQLKKNDARYPDSTLFRTDATDPAAPGPPSTGPQGIPVGGLAYQPAASGGPGTLWVGDFTVVRHVTLTGKVLASVLRPGDDTLFVDGLEFVGAT